MKREKLAALFLAAVAAIGLGAATNARAVVPNCSTVTLVTESCGWVITTPGCYKLENSLTASTNAGDCIQINSSNVYLDLNRQTIEGTGAASTGSGVHVLAQTTPGAVVITNVAVQGGSINGFNQGVLVGNPVDNLNVAPFPTRIRLDNIISQNNNLQGFEIVNAKVSQFSGLHGTGNEPGGVGFIIFGGSSNELSNSVFTANGDGVDVSGSSGNVFSAVTASSNADYGFNVYNSTGNKINSPAADSNGGAGIFLNGKANANTIAGGHANSNGTPGFGFGVWVEQSSANEISGIELSDNVVAGIYLGCDGPTTGTCTGGTIGIPMSNGNGIDANVNITGATGWGIALDKGNLSNTIVGNVSSSNAILDEYDGNKCGVNNWFADNFGTSSSSCVH